MNEIVMPVIDQAKEVVSFAWPHFIASARLGAITWLIGIACAFGASGLLLILGSFFRRREEDEVMGLCYFFAILIGAITLIVIACSVHGFVNAVWNPEYVAIKDLGSLLK